MPGPIDKSSSDVERALQQPSVITISSGKSEIGETIRRTFKIPESFSSGALSIESESQTARDITILNRRAMMGASQCDLAMNPSVLVVRKIEGIGPIRPVSPPQAPAAGLGVALASTQDTSLIFATDRFLLQQVNEADQEKIGPIYTFAKSKLYCSGRQPKIYTYGGMLVDNAIDGSAKAFWWWSYDEYLRGSKCVQNNVLVELYYRDQIRRGYLLHTNMLESASTPSLTQFAFSMHVIDEASYATWIDGQNVYFNVKDIIDRD